LNSRKNSIKKAAWVQTAFRKTFKKPAVARPVSVPPFLYYRTKGTGNQYVKFIEGGDIYTRLILRQQFIGVIVNGE